ARRDVVGLTYEDLTLRKVSQKRKDYFEREQQRYEPLALSVYSGPPNQYTSVKLLNPMPSNRDGSAQQVHILTGGSLEAPGEIVGPGVLSAPHISDRDDAGWGSIPDSTTGRR